MNAFKVVRLLLKYSNPLVIAVAVFFVGLSLTFYRQCNAKKQQLQQQNQIIVTLKQQLQQEKQAQRRLLAAHQRRIADMRQREQRVDKWLKIPAVRASSQQPLSPLFKHALSELRAQQEAAK